MKSTGEVLGIDSDYNKALLKAFQGAGYKFRNSGKVLVSLSDAGKEEGLKYVKTLSEQGFDIIGTEGTCKFINDNGIKCDKVEKDNINKIQEMMKEEEIALFINVPTKGKDSSRSGFKLRTLAEHLKVPCFTCYDTVDVYIKAMETYRKNEELNYEGIEFYM
jgi:carbamoyl-phosphate synthase large subunit